MSGAEIPAQLVERMAALVRNMAAPGVPISEMTDQARAIVAELPGENTDLKRAIRQTYETNKSLNWPFGYEDLNDHGYSCAVNCTLAGIKLGRELEQEAVKEAEHRLYVKARDELYADTSRMLRDALEVGDIGTCIRVVRATDGWINLSWGDGPHDLVMQNDAQIDDLICKLQAVRGR